MPLQDTVEQGAVALRDGWQALLDSDGSQDAPWRALALRTVSELDASRAAVAGTKSHLMDIMMAQDFQDLTGQVISKVAVITQTLEQQLVQMLVDFAPEEVRRELDNGLLNGPQINPEGKSDIVADQTQVDDLLDSLGF